MKSVNALLEYMKQHDMDAFFLAKKTEHPLHQWIHRR